MNMDNTLQNFNRFREKITFTAEKKNDHKINYLDLTTEKIMRKIIHYVTRTEKFYMEIYKNQLKKIHPHQEIK